MIIPRLVGVMLPGAPSPGDPSGAKDHATRRTLNLTFSLALALRASRVNGVATMQALILNEFGMKPAIFAEDQTRATAMSWHTLQDIDI